MLKQLVIKIITTEPPPQTLITSVQKFCVQQIQQHIQTKGLISTKFRFLGVKQFLLFFSASICEENIPGPTVMDF